MIRRARKRRTGSASLDYVLILCIILPMMTFLMTAGPKIMRLTYDMVCVLVSWPLM